MPHLRPDSLGPFRVSERAASYEELARDINHALDQITHHVSRAFGLMGHVELKNNLDMQGNALLNVGESGTPTNAATVAQIQRLERLLDEAQTLLSQVQAQVTRAASLSNASPAQVSVVASPGGSGLASRDDHVHTIALAAWASPGPIGGTTPAAGAFTTLALPNRQGQVTIADAATTGLVSLSPVELDANYRTHVTPVTNTGTPALNSTTIVAVTKAANQFVVTVAVAPGAGNSVTFDWVVHR